MRRLDSNSATQIASEESWTQEPSILDSAKPGCYNPRILKSDDRPWNSAIAMFALVSEKSALGPPDHSFEVSQRAIDSPLTLRDLGMTALPKPLELRFARGTPLFCQYTLSLYI